MESQQLQTYDLAIQNRRLVTVVMGMTLLMGLVACMAYLAGRSVSSIRTGLPERHAEAVRVVEPSQEAAAMPANDIPAPKPIFVQEVAAPVEPTPRGVYLQVGAVDQGSAAKLKARIETAGFHVEFVSSGSLVRVLAGPFDGKAQERDASAKLASMGLDHFPRRL